ncbi:peroxidase-like [Adelges cooleyi]|uniref:peroxidase-like n=1 Tax=Adelges cooleyi TaxID=133065 RepID=UPI00217F6D35|nr:peroxidase-like [Adelges cooleyi]XP_050433059.1 peroxidase-like [Adelges cooleyi]XP_050433060.1 peroxidase-like [Adelges cooleyi]XP_050433061.1 peroxidase-like [Adelges cooleyi]XP_050433062.1 peroxidase-like [Adelges cooleyi]XP_050433063.1 peroxidase-like [Adelges cooleyi]
MNLFCCFVTFGIGFSVYLNQVVDSFDQVSQGPLLEYVLSAKEQNAGDVCSAAKFFLTCNSSYEYRTINGNCTNLEHPTWGMANTATTRLLPALYKDGIMEIRTQKSGRNLDTPRVLSDIFFTDLNFEDDLYTMSVMQWGQLIAHDVTLSPTKNGPSCCGFNQPNQPSTKSLNSCQAISVPADDKFYSRFNVTCMDLQRIFNTLDIKCNITPALPINLNTAFIDASFVYGSSDRISHKLRQFKNGLLKSKKVHGREFPLNVLRPELVCNEGPSTILCIQAGDARANLFPLIAVMQIIFVRIHNWIVFELKKMNNHWDDETLYQEGRRIVCAIVQHITYKHYLPIIIGETYMNAVQLTVNDEGYNNVYDPMVNPQILTEFSGCAFRSFHSMLVNDFELVDSERRVVGTWKLNDNYNKVSMVAEGKRFDELITAMAHQRMGKMDRFFPVAITGLLFQSDGLGQDLESADIGRGRDIGLNTYGQYLKMAGRKYPEHWEDLDGFMEHDMIELLKTKYESIEEVEPFVGGILENSVEGSILGPTFVTVIAEQFSRLQRGDRFYYENGDLVHPFTPEQLQEIRKTSLSMLFCMAGDDIKTMQPDAFRKVSKRNPLKNCNHIIGDFSFNPWKHQNSWSLKNVQDKFINFFTSMPFLNKF